MISITTVPDESPSIDRRRISLASRAFGGCMIYGTTLVLIPAIAAGIVSSLLRLGDVPMGSATVIGLAVGFALGARELVRVRRLNTTRRCAAEAREQIDRERGVVEVISVTDIVAALDVDDLEDFGPAYLLRTRDDQMVYLAGERLQWDDEKGELIDIVVSDTVVAIRRPGTKELTNVRWSGKPVPVTGSINVTELRVEFWSQCEILPPEIVADYFDRST